jgi:hypothetical protein
LDEDLADAIRKEIRSPEHKVLVYPTLPRAYTDMGVFKVEHPTMEGLWIEPEATLYYSYFPNASGIRKALAFGRQPTWPSVRRTIIHDDKDLSLLKVGGADEDEMPRGYIPKGLVPDYTDDTARVFKTGNEHCGEGKTLIRPPANKGLTSKSVEEGGLGLMVTGYSHIAKEDTLVEPFIEGESYRVLLIGKQAWVIRYESRDWRKNVGGTQTLVEPTLEHNLMLTWARSMAAGSSLPVVGVDFVLDASGTKHFLELNCYPGIPEEAKPAFVAEAVAWFNSESRSLW